MLCFFSLEWTRTSIYIHFQSGKMPSDHLLKTLFQVTRRPMLVGTVGMACKQGLLSTVLGPLCSHPPSIVRLPTNALHLPRYLYQSKRVNSPVISLISNQEAFRPLGNMGEQMFTDRVINMMPCPVYRPLAPYFLFKAVESKNISCCLTKGTSVFQMNTWSISSPAESSHGNRHFTLLYS